jgi:ABC-type branched-subunit amino acid transport system substrate-binding protein
MHVTGKVVTALAASSVILALASCSSSGSDGKAAKASGSAASTAPSATGTPILIGMIAPTSAPIYSVPDQVAAVRAAIGTINAQGGVKGHPLQLDYCNESNDANKGAACGRSVAASNDVATVASVSPFAGTAVSQALQAAGLANIGYTALTSQEYASPNNFPTDGGGVFLQPAGLVGALKADSSLKKVAIAANEGPASQPIVDATATAAAKAGGTVVKTVRLPLTTIADFTPYAQQIVSSGAQVAVLSMSGPVAVGMIQAVHQLGGKVVFTTSTGVINEAILKKLGPLGNGMYLGSPTPWIHDTARYPGVNDYIASMKTELDRGDSDADLSKALPNSMMDWVSTMRLRDVLVSITDKGQEITRASVLAAFNSATNLKTYNIVKNPWNPSVKQTSLSGFQNVSVTETYVLTTSEGQEKLLSPDPIEVTPYLH